MPKISIFIPVYNGSKYIEQTIKSILSQICIDFELLCVDDSSTENSLERLNELEQEDSRRRFLQNRIKNQFPSPGNLFYLI